MSELKPFPVHDTDVSHVVIEVFGGDNNLSDFVIEDLQEAATGNRGNFSLLALADFADNQTYVIEMSPRTGNRIIDRWGEKDTGDPETLAEFLSRALMTYRPEVRKALGFWDHGSGVFDEYDPNETLLERRLARVSRQGRSRSFPARRLFLSKSRLLSDARARAMLHDDTDGGVLTNLEAHHTLKVAFQRAGYNQKVDMIFSDTCLNGMIEVLEQLKEFAECIVASEDLEPGDGWDYFEWFAMMSQQPPATSQAWSRQAVEAFEAGYRDRPRAHPCTLGAFRAENDMTIAFAELLKSLQNQGRDGFAWLHQARIYAQSFANKDTYDMKDFMLKLKGIASARDVESSVNRVLAAFDEARVHSVALGNEVVDSYGLAFWFPSSRYIFQRDAATYARLEFNKTTHWVEYLETNYAG